jgi:hypothetical protein
MGTSVICRVTAHIFADHPRRPTTGQLGQGSQY